MNAYMEFLVVVLLVTVIIFGASWLLKQILPHAPNYKPGDVVAVGDIYRVDEEDKIGISSKVPPLTSLERITTSTAWIDFGDKVEIQGKYWEGYVVMALNSNSSGLQRGLVFRVPGRTFDKWVSRLKAREGSLERELNRRAKWGEQNKLDQEKWL
ncbi:MAG: hypothetical protein JKY59_00065 [Emcibacter sp.]|nr:hypothetical protein [Emcibacter sp.]